MAELVGPISDWAKRELEDCFNGIDIDIEGDFYLEENGEGGYVENAMVHGHGANVHGKLDVFGTTAHRVAMAIRIENAESIEDLPEGLSDEDEDIRDLAKEVLEELGYKTDEEQEDEVI